MTLRELAARIAAFVTRRHGRGDLDDQLQFHREMLEEQLRSQGLTAADAAREARRRIGGPAQIGEAWQDQRSLPWLETCCSRWAMPHPCMLPSVSSVLSTIRSRVPCSTSDLGKVMGRSC